jgi:hypothetical protein
MRPHGWTWGGRVTLYRRRFWWSGRRRAAAVTLVLAIAAALGPPATAARAGDIYRWVDESGREHYSNAPSRVQSSEPAERVPMPAVPPSAEGSAGGQAHGGASDQAGGGAEATATATSAEIALGRAALEREHREAKAQLADVDRELGELAAARTRFADAGIEAAGGVRASGAAGVRSEEETALEKEREALVARLDGIESRYAELRAQAAVRHGGKIPAGWQRLE